MNTEFLENFLNPLEEVSISYQMTDRFLEFIYAENHNQLSYQTEFDILLEEFMYLMSNKQINIDKLYFDLPRKYSEYDIKSQSSMLLAIRIINLKKILFIIKKFPDKYNKNLIKKLHRTLDTLQLEFQDLYDVKFLEEMKYSDDMSFKMINGHNLSFTEYLINKNLNIYFDSSKLANDKFYNKNQCEMYKYMSLIFIHLELQFLTSDFDLCLRYTKEFEHFIAYKQMSRNVKSEENLWENKYIPEIEDNIDFEFIEKYRLNHQVIIISTEDEEVEKEIEDD